MLDQRRFAPTDTTVIILTLAHHTAITAPNGSRAASLSARGPGITGLTGIGAITAGPATTAGAGTDEAGAATGTEMNGANVASAEAGIMTAGATMTAMAGAIENGTVTADSMVAATGIGTDAGSATKD